MNTILQNTPYGTATGEIKINGVVDNDLGKKNVVGFVPQDDIVRSELSVFQNLYYNALVRLPSTTPMSDKLKHVQNSIKVLTNPAQEVPEGYLWPFIFLAGLLLAAALYFLVVIAGKLKEGLMTGKGHQKADVKWVETETFPQGLRGKKKNQVFRSHILGSV